MTEKAGEYFAYQIDLEQYFQWLQQTKRPQKAKSSSTAQKTKNQLKIFSNMELDSLSKARFTFTPSAEKTQGYKEKRSCSKNKPKRKDSLDSLSSGSGDDLQEILATSTAPISSTESKITLRKQEEPGKASPKRRVKLGLKK